MAIYFGLGLKSWVFVLCLGLLVLSMVGSEPRGRRRRPKGDKQEETQIAKNSKDLEEKSNERTGKLFSLFNIVQFKNDGCRSTSSISGGGTGSTFRNGTCFTTNECQSKSGTAAGTCAAGFGVCCVFMVSNSGGIVNQNCSYVRNPGFPNSYTETSSVQYTINKCAANICHLRLDFESFSILGTGNTEEINTGLPAGATAPVPVAAGGICQDTFDASVSTNQRIPTICGQNTGQHMYLDVGLLASDSATLNFAFSGTAVNRMWEIKVTQIPCGSDCSKFYSPPPGCLQYHTGITGRFTTFNFNPTNDNHLQKQDYSVCIRQEEGFCCVQYMACMDQGSFSLDTMGMMTMMAQQDTFCTLDFIAIHGSSGTCNQGSNANPITNKYCGPFFSAFPNGPVSDSVCDCTEPFAVDIFTDMLDDIGMMGTTAMANTIQSRGVCLTYMQIPCN